jgi:hypothetical protein
MAKVNLDRIEQRYGWKGAKYQELMTWILAENHKTTQATTGRKLARFFTDRIARAKTGGVITPKIADILSVDSVYIRKGAERGTLLVDTLRAELNTQIKAALNKHIGSGEQIMQTMPGGKPARIKPQLVAKFKDAISDTFSGYMKGAIPANIQTIATTEIYSAISEVRHTYALRMAEMNPGRIRTLKRWSHSRRHNRVARIGHRTIDGATVLLNQGFQVPRYKNGKKIETTIMQYPHDYTAPADQVINCECECQYIVEIL